MGGVTTRPRRAADPDDIRRSDGNQGLVGATAVRLPGAEFAFVIPELIRGIDYRKGVYYADAGDFSSAGAADIRYYDAMPEGLARVEGGSFGHLRGVAAGTVHLGPGHLLFGGEALHGDGPWDHPDNFRKFNGVLRYSQENGSRGFWPANRPVPMRGDTTTSIFIPWNRSQCASR